MLATVLAIACAGATFPVQAQAGSRVGRIIIEGNTETPDRAILELLSARPGAVLRAEDLVATRERLRKCGFFLVNPWRGIGPTVQMLPNELGDTFVDIRIRVNERPGNWLRYEVREVMTTAALGDRVEVVFAVWSLVDRTRERIVRREP
jgi:outer membrane protein assembly factor BamA